jgi:hypothetical protein
MTSATEVKTIFEIINPLGQVMMHTEAFLPAGTNLKQFDIANLSRGVYFIRSQYADKTLTTRFTKL